MARRLFCAFGVILLLSGILSSVHAAQEIDSSGKYFGFFQGSGRWGLMEFVIEKVRNHRFQGSAAMIVGPDKIRVPFVIEGTVSQSGELTGLGRGPAGIAEFHGQITFFDGGAAIADATYRLTSPPPEPDLGTRPAGLADRGTATLLRNFIVGPDAPPPSVAGLWTGMSTSAVDKSTSTFTLDVRQECVTSSQEPTPGTGFSGHEVIDIESKNPLEFDFLGSVSSDARFAVIGWDLTNDRFIVTGTYYPPDPGKGATAAAQYTLIFGNGFTDRGTFSMAQQPPPEPDCPAPVR